MSKIVYANVTVLDIVVALVILLAAMIASRFVAVYLRRILKETIEKSQLDILIKVIRYGIRDEVTLAGCGECHINRERFCDRCHLAASVTLDCFKCHYYPESSTTETAMLERR